MTCELVVYIILIRVELLSKHYFVYVMHKFAREIF
jgi:hypothetical protein